MIKSIFAGLFALFLSFTACSEVINFSYKQEQSTASTLNVPFRGGLVLIDQKRSPFETQYLRFELEINDYFSVWPDDHIFVLADASLNFEPNPNLPYAGRGIILDRRGMYIEDFSNSNLYSFVPVELKQGKRYSVMVHVNGEYVAGFVNEINYNSTLGLKFSVPLAYTVARVLDPTPKSRASLMIIGALTDFSKQDKRNSVDLVISNIEHGRFTP